MWPHGVTGSVDGGIDNHSHGALVKVLGSSGYMKLKTMFPIFGGHLFVVLGKGQKIMDQKRPQDMEKNRKKDEANCLEGLPDFSRN